MSLIHAALFGLVEGITEFLPISSTGHLILTARLLGLSQNEFLKSFEIAIQAGAILAVLALYGRKLFSDFELLKRVLAAFIPTGILGLLLYKVVKRFLLGGPELVLCALFLGGVALIVFECWYKRQSVSRILPVETQMRDIPYGKAVTIGFFQSLAMIPGVSRSAATIVGGLALGIPRRTITEFSFLLAAPTLIAATALDLSKHSSSFTADQSAFLLTGGAVSFVVALLSIKFLLGFIKNHTFIGFGVYRITVALLFWALVR